MRASGHIYTYGYVESMVTWVVSRAASESSCCLHVFTGGMCVRPRKRARTIPSWLCGAERRGKGYLSLAQEETGGIFHSSFQMQVWQGEWIYVKR